MSVLFVRYSERELRSRVAFDCQRTAKQASTLLRSLDSQVHFAILSRVHVDTCRVRKGDMFVVIVSYINICILFINVCMIILSVVCIFVLIKSHSTFQLPFRIFNYCSR